MSPQFGRIPVETVNRFEQTVTLVKERVLPALPDTSGEDLRAFTLERVLETVFRDWHEHGNTDPLSEEDLGDLASFVQMSASVAGNQLSPQNRPIYEASLQGLLEDWLYNWNTEGHNGPPVSARL